MAGSATGVVFAGELAFAFVGVSFVLLVAFDPLAGSVSGVGVLGLKKPLRVLCEKPGPDFVDASLLRATLPFLRGRG